MTQGCCPWTPTEAYMPGPCKPEFWKNDLPANLFLLYVLPQSVIKLHRLLNISNINTHFDMFWKIKACMVVINFLVCVRKHKSNLPPNIRTTVGKKTQWYVENATFWVKPHSCLILWRQWCVFFYQSVYFFYQWCLSGLSSQHYVSMTFVLQYPDFHHNIMFLWFL